MPTAENKNTWTVLRKITDKLKAKAAELGFTLAGILPAGLSETHQFYLEWLESGFAGEMAYLHRHADLKRNASALLPTARSIVALAYPYPAREHPRGAGNDGFQGRISRYARGTDYHKTISSKLDSLAEWLEFETGTTVLSRGFVDSGPVMEREMAARAGLGWVGKNAMLIHWEQGSWLFLAELLVDLPLAPDRPESHPKARSGDGDGSLAGRLGLKESCGSCTACIDACPTGAIVAEKTVDSRLCISYLTIELKGPIPISQRKGLGDWVFGCDVCQEVCPWNHKSPNQESPARGAVNYDALNHSAPNHHAPNQNFSTAEDNALRGHGASLRLDLAGLLGLDDNAFRERFRDTAIWRTKRRGLLRNAAIALGNLVGERMDGGSEGTGSKAGIGAREPIRSAREALAGAMGDPEPLVRGAAAWALGRFLGDETARGILSNALAGESHPEVRQEIAVALREMETPRPG